MAKLQFELVGYNDALNTMTVNDKFVKFQKNKQGKRVCTVETNKDVAEVIIYQSHHYNGKAWFWWNLFCYFISIFGIFDVRQNKRFLVVDCRFNITLSQDTNVVLNILKFEDNGKLLEVETDAQVEQLTNIQYFDTEAKAKHKKMKKAKLLLTFGIILAGAIAGILVAVL